MAGRQIYNPDGFKNMEKDGQITGFQFEMKAQYYRGMTLSIVRKLDVEIDGESVDREDIRFSVNGEIHHGRNENGDRFRLQMGVRRFCDNQRLKRRRTFQGNTSY